MQKIIHIGAGNGAELEGHIKNGAEHIVLVEPLPSWAENLRQVAKKTQSDGVRVDVIEAAVTDDPKCNQLQEYNFNQLSSLRTPTELFKLYPGLKTTRVHTVATLTPSQLAEQLCAESDSSTFLSTLLVLQAPGAEMDIIKALIRDDRLKYFTHLKITTNLEPLYTGAQPAAALISDLQDYGYDLLQRTPEDADWPELDFILSPLKQRLDASMQEVAGLKAHLAESEAKRAETHKWFMGRKEQALKGEETIKSLSHELEVVTAKYDQVKTQLESLQSANDQLGRLESILVNMLNAQNQQLQQNTNALGQHVTRMFKENACKTEATDSD